MDTTPTKPAEEFIGTEELQTLALAMDKKYDLFLKGRHFAIVANKEGECASVVVTLKNANDSFFYPVEGRINIVTEEFRTARKAALFLIDYIDLYFESFFEEAEDLLLPIDWAKYEYEAVDFELRGQVLNLFAERMGDELLKAGPVGAELH